VLADWLADAGAWLTVLRNSRRADYPQRRHRAGEMYPVRFRVGELDDFLAGLETAAGAMRAMAAPLPSNGLPAPPVTRALPAGWRVVK
jgi:hypothetical protein